MTVSSAREGSAPDPAPSTTGAQPREILVVKPSSLGDVVHTLPAVALIKRRWPDAHLRWLINPEWAPLLEGNPFVDEVDIFPRGKFRGLWGWTRIPSWARSIASRPADLVLDFQGLLRSALIARLCRAEGGEIVGRSDAREGAALFYQRKAQVRATDHAVERCLSLATALGIPITQPLEWPLPRGNAPAGFDATTPYILLHPFSRGRGKSLSVTDVTALCRALEPRRVVLVGRADESIASGRNVESLLNQTSLAELIWLTRHAAFVVSVDSGPMHIAAALTSRLLAIHTWTDPRDVGPYQPEAWIWQNGALFQAGDQDHRQEMAGIEAVAAFLRTLV